MASKSRPRTISVYLYIPNIIGYIRVLMNCFAFGICFSNKELFSVLYFISFAVSASFAMPWMVGLPANSIKVCLWYAVILHVSVLTIQFHDINLGLMCLADQYLSTFGAVLDMVTDRISTACLLVILSQVYRPSFVFLSLLALDIASHWLQMYSTFLVGKSNHKDVKDSTSWLFKLYYGNRMFMGYCCVACELLYITLFLLAKENEKMIDVLLGAARQSIIYSALLAFLLFGWATKQLVNVIQVS
ncbi:hypothetical protein OSB04_030798 [Centaurea solstitialis]|uniref:CDP-diacylglycerol--inositol 3-phosphatidyltransferase n=1 Tax=Centaurea solstitialis TaxID=347529 RepID=A0AA38S8B7_9ASTR|nr:hypothetical protein OSB04_030798 [Centaurea solstitialis]